MEMVSTLDVVPTILRLAAGGTSSQAASNDPALDGQDISDVLLRSEEEEARVLRKAGQHHQPPTSQRVLFFWRDAPLYATVLGLRTGGLAARLLSSRQSSVDLVTHRRATR